MKHVLAYRVMEVEPDTERHGVSWLPLDQLKEGDTFGDFIWLGNGLEMEMELTVRRIAPDSESESKE